MATFSSSSFDANDDLPPHPPPPPPPGAPPPPHRPPRPFFFFYGDHDWLVFFFFVIHCPELYPPSPALPRERHVFGDSFPPHVLLTGRGRRPATSLPLLNEHGRAAIIVSACPLPLFPVHAWRPRIRGCFFSLSLSLPERVDS